MRGFLYISLLLAWCILSTACDFKGDEHAARIYFDDPKVLSLIKAASRGDIDRIDRMIAKGADVNALGKDNITPLLWLLAAKGHPDKRGFKYLVERGADPLIMTTPTGDTALMIAAIRPDPFYLKTLLETGVDPNFFHPYWEMYPTALFHAVSSGNYEHIQLLLDHGADIELLNERGDTVLVYTTLRDWRAVYILLQNGADYSAKDTLLGYTIADMIEKVRYFPPKDGSTDWREKVIDFLRDRGVEVDPAMPPYD